MEGQSFFALQQRVEEQAKRIADLDRRINEFIRRLSKLCGCPLLSDCIHDPNRAQIRVKLGVRLI